MKNTDNVELMWSATDVKLSSCTVIHSDTSIAITEQTVYHEIWLLLKSKSIFYFIARMTKQLLSGLVIIRNIPWGPFDFWSLRQMANVFGHENYGHFHFSSCFQVLY